MCTYTSTLTHGHSRNFSPPAHACSGTLNSVLYEKSSHLSTSVKPVLMPKDSGPYSWFQETITSGVRGVSLKPHAKQG